MNFKEIADAWIRSYSPTDAEKQLAEERLLTCKGNENNKPCEHFKTLIGFAFCAACVCPIDKKIFASDKNSCPEKKWEN